MIQGLLEKMKLPALLINCKGEAVQSPAAWQARRQELLDMLSREQFGFAPAAPASIQAEVEKQETAFGGKAVQRRIRISFDTPVGAFSFPYVLLTPAEKMECPAFLSLNFVPDIPNHCLPAEEVIDHGFALAVLYYQDVTSDSGEWDGMACHYPRDERTGWGKIGMWAFAASRVMDDLLTRPEIDGSRVAITGHSRLGKTALWCGAQDERFSMVISNASGCAGAALARGNTGERVKNITDMFPYWFCGNYRSWANREDEMPFDQHMLLALAAPRGLYVSSGSQDGWACPENEFLGCAAAGPAWQLHGKAGLAGPDQAPGVHQPLHEGWIGHHIRPGTHFFSRTDWGYHMAFREKHNI